MLLVALLVQVPPASAKSPVRIRQFYTTPELKRAFPTATFAGDVRVERSATIQPGAVLKQTGSQPLYVLGRSTVRTGSTLVQEGNKPMVLLHSDVKAGANGHGTVVHSTLTGGWDMEGGRVLRTTGSCALGRWRGSLVDVTTEGGVFTGNPRVRRTSSRYGIISSNERHPLTVQDKTLDLQQVLTPKAFKSDVRRRQFPMETVTTQVYNDRGQTRGAIQFSRRSANEPWNPSVAGGGIVDIFR